MAKMTFGEAVRVVRQRQGLTQAALAARARLARQTLVGIEKAPGSPPPGTYNRLVGALGFTLGRDLFLAAGDTRELLVASGPTRAALERAALAVALSTVSSPAALARRTAEKSRVLPALAVVRRPQRPRRRLASSTARGYGVAHRRLRKFILLRDPWCQGFPPGIHRGERVRTTVMDHRVSLRRGGTTSPDNCFGSCRPCNARKAVMVEGAGFPRLRSGQQIETTRASRWRLLA